MGMSNQREEAHHAETQEELLLMAQVFNTIKSHDDQWFLDSGCSNHICGNKFSFSDLDESYHDSVKLGNNTSMVVLGKGNIRLQVNSKAHIVTDVFFVPELRNNLLSIGQL